jgi:hypothetical protein
MKEGRKGRIRKRENEGGKKEGERKEDKLSQIKEKRKER